MMINPNIQEYFDGEAFDPEDGYVDLDIRDKKIRHIQLHVAKAAMKLALGDERKIVGEVIPDVAIYRSQMINIVGPVNLSCYPGSFSGSLVRFAPGSEAALRSLEMLSMAGGNLATYLERKEHGRPADPVNLVAATINLHEAAFDLGERFDVDVDKAHIQRLEGLLGRALPADLVS